MDEAKLEKYSSAITLSDMEIFVFPGLMYSLVLADIMSPIIWRWREEDCFAKLGGKDSYKKLMRLKQFIMDEYEFNLDLETWGLTDRNVELKRFEKFISPEDIAKSNALFGYHGDEYYFDVDIRKHFGLDKYDSDIIPYWKTETVEAMDAFRLKEGYKTGAGECVSLAALYAAAAFVVCQIPFEDIYMILTPLHSQNFIDIKDGVLTNNRRLVTKTMWFNGTEISNKAQRALRNEQVTIVARNSGYVHCFYDEATMDKNSYEKFNSLLGSYLSEKCTLLTLANFLRFKSDYQPYFQFCCDGCRGGEKFAPAEVLFHYEHGSNFRIADEKFERLIAEIADQDILISKMPDRMCCKQLVQFLEYEELDVRRQSDWLAVKDYLGPFVPEVDKLLSELADFLHIEAKLPKPDKKYINGLPIKLSVDMSREEVIDYLHSIRKNNETVELAFYAYRDMESCRWEPFVKAAVERNPVSLEAARSMQENEVYQWLSDMPNESIYNGKRLAQPDEVANYKTGDGLEKAFVLSNILLNRFPDKGVEIVSSGDNVVVNPPGYRFDSHKGLAGKIKIEENNRISIST
ncbi:MAG: hypothetical protein JW804_00935 [Sedimentisphaerales bacterium]|nr:hypothetical protein [Sedimentisphaerales bacterium]